MGLDKDRGILGFKLGPVRRAVYGFIGTGNRPSYEPAKPVDELDLMAERAAQRYRARIEGAVERYKKNWAEAMRK